MRFTPIDGRGLREIDVSPGRQFGGIPEYKIPKSRWQYIELSCGHLTTPEEQESFRLWRPKRGMYWCHHWPIPCGWVKLPPKPKPKASSDVPLF